MESTVLKQKTCPICEHWNNIIANQTLGEVDRLAAKVKLSTHQYFEHFKIKPEVKEV